MSKFDQITVVSVSGNNDGRDAVNAIIKSVTELPGSRGLLLAMRKPCDLPSVIDFVQIGGLDYFQYSFFMVHCLYYHVQTDYVLVVQDDGWVLNGSNWDDNWFNYDYVGGVCHVAGVGGRLVLNYSWVGNPSAVPVMNGGFSFRSRAFLEAPTKYGLCYKSSDVPILRNEDIQLCLILRDGLEARGLRFAPLKAAYYFSVDMHPVIHAGIDLYRLFGHHGQSRRLRANATVETNLTQASIDGIFGENRIIALLENYGYTVRRK